MDTLFAMCGICQGEKSVCPNSAMPFEVWHMIDGRKLLHVDAGGKQQYWIKLIPAAVEWLKKELEQ